MKAQSHLLDMKIKKSSDRGQTQLEWLKSYHSFSFGNYHDPKQMNFRALRVINEDWIEPAQGFGSHPHRDMEIITYVVEGALQHKDSLGTGSEITAGDLQKMSAGTGIVHSEFNASAKKAVHLLQIWILPEKLGLKPEYQQISVRDKAQKGLTLIASAKKKPGVIHVHQDVEMFLGKMEQGQKETYSLSAGRGVWLQLIKGKILINQQMLKSGDALFVDKETVLEIKSQKDSEFLLFDLK